MSDSPLYEFTQETPNDKPDIARCSECRWEGPVSDCETEEESEGWEYPSYLVHICPKCGYSIDDYTWSDEAWDAYIKLNPTKE